MDLVTGATGFIGGRLVKRLGVEGRQCRLLTRTASSASLSSCYVIADLDNQHGLATSCKNIDTVYHCAGRAHAFNPLTTQDKHQLWTTNFTATDSLAKIAGQAGVRKFIFLSSVKAMPEPGNRCVDESWKGSPVTAYGQSKRAAEEAILEAGRRYGMHVVILRLTMVYGAGGRGNLERMGRCVRRGLFPPLPETGNHRSLIHVDDVVTAMRLVANDDKANGRTYIITSPESPSGRQLYDAMHDVLGLPITRWSVPETILRGIARWGDFFKILLKRRVPLDSEIVDRLLGSAWYSSDRIAQELGWQANISLHEGLREMLVC